MTDGSHSKVKLNVRVPPSKKDEWKTALDDGETLTSLVQRAVDREIRDEYIHRDNLDNIAAGAPADIDFGEVTDRLDHLQGAVETLQTQLDDQLGHEGYDEEKVRDVAMKVTDYIPEAPDTDAVSSYDERLRYIENEIYKQQDGPSMGGLDGSAEKIAGLAGQDDIALVREALIFLENRTTVNVDSVIVDGTRHWVQV
ncbi:hypothetical protein ABSL23_01515 [Halobacterium sp. NMX12-1]|uniref:CopG family transcriptional regulator n=1 Tax=Halobacterium sp. NMX12-1 TaxID=3166650 RepID=A0AAU8CDM7_9EURY